jgi:hypothetical protein
MASMMLHNLCISGNLPLDEDEDGDEADNDGEANADNDDVDHNAAVDGMAGQGANPYANQQQAVNGWEVRQNLIQQRFA